MEVKFGTTFMKTFLRILVSLAITLGSFSTLAQSKPTFVFVKIIESIEPLARGDKYEEPLDSALKKAKLGEVTGGGSLLSKEKKIEWVGVDVELTDLEKGIPFLKRKLVELGVPKGSLLEYEFQGKKVQDPIHANVETAKVP